MADDKRIKKSELKKMVSNAEQTTLSNRLSAAASIAKKVELTAGHQPQSFGDLHNAYLKQFEILAKRAKGNRPRLAGYVLDDLVARKIMDERGRAYLGEFLALIMTPEITLANALIQTRKLYQRMLAERASRESLALCSIAVGSLEHLEPQRMPRWLDILTDDFLGGCAGGVIGSLIPGAGTTVGFLGGAIATSAISAL